MNPSEFRANAAGYLDGAATLVRTVQDALKVGETMKDERNQPKVACPPAIYELLAEADARLSKVAGWLLDNTYKLD